MSSPATSHRPLGLEDALATALRLPLERKVALLTGASTWALTPIAESGLRGIVLSDGPIGVRGDADDLPSAQLPAPSATAATWDEGLQRRIGRLIAGEAARKGVDVVLAPVVNLQRSPVGGRHFECLSEDPLLTGRLASAYIESVQQHGVAACVKHFVGNETETDRTEYVVDVDERTLREVYLAPFERVVRNGAWCVMAAYNGVDVDGVAAPATAHRPLLHDILKGEWGFDGVVVSDWLATGDTVESALGGLDLVMPGPSGPWGERLVSAVRAGTVPESEIDDKVARIVRLGGRVGALGGGPDARRAEPGPAPDATGVRDLLCELAARATVVLRNDGGLLPLADAGIDRIALIGHNAVEPFTQGGGSAFVTAPLISAPIDALRAAFPRAEVVFERGGATTGGAPIVSAAIVATPGGEQGILVEEVDAHGSVLTSHVVTDPARLWLPIHDERAVSARIVADIRLDGRGTHTLEIAPVGAHRIVLDGIVAGSSTLVVGTEVVLDSSYANPVAHTVDVEVAESSRTVRLVVDAQIVDAAAYGHFVRAHLRHRRPGRSIDEELAAAVAAAAAADVAVVVVGTNHETESEGWDRPDLDLPGRQDELVRRVAAANPRTVVVVNAGAPVLLPWLDEVPAVLWWWLPGQEAGTSLAAVLTGRIEPSGRLPWTLPARFEDVPVPNGIPIGGRIRYDEGLDIGHRAWDRRGSRPAREFGFGLGYAHWRYDDLDVTAAPDGGLRVRVTLTNDSGRDGREVVQVYLSRAGGSAPEPVTTPVAGAATAPRTPGSQASRPASPLRWLAGFGVVDVRAGETVVVDVPVEPRSLQEWSTRTRAWTTVHGGFVVHAGRSSRELPLTSRSAVHPVDAAPVTPGGDDSENHTPAMQGGIST